MRTKQCDSKTMEGRITKLRQKKGYSQLYVAEQIALDEKCYCKRENGKISFTVNDIKNLSNLYDVSTDHIILGIERKPEGHIYEILKRQNVAFRRKALEIVKALLKEFGDEV